MSLPCCGDGWFVFWSADATGWFDEEWICFDWSVTEHWRMWDMVFCLRLTGHWFGGLSYELYVYAKCFCWQDT